MSTEDGGVSYDGGLSEEAPPQVSEDTGPPPATGAPAHPDNPSGLSPEELQRLQDIDKPLEDDPIGNAIPGLIAAPFLAAGEAVVEGVELTGAMVMKEVAAHGVGEMLEHGVEAVKDFFSEDEEEAPEDGEGGEEGGPGEYDGGEGGADAGTDAGAGDFDEGPAEIQDNGLSPEEGAEYDGGMSTEDGGASYDGGLSEEEAP